MKRVICISGGIGSGKSTVCSYLKGKGFGVYNSDERAKILMHQDERLRSQIIDAFSSKAYTVSGELNRTFLSEQIFKNPSSKAILESFVHPAMRSDFASWAASQEQNVVFKESALAIEIEDQSCSELLVVLASMETRIERVLGRSPELTRADIKKRIEHQVSDQIRREKASFVIENEGSLESLHKQVDQFLTRII